MAVAAVAFVIECPCHNFKNFNALFAAMKMNFIDVKFLITPKYAFLLLPSTYIFFC